MSDLDDLLDNEHARLNGETLRHLDGMGSRNKRARAARTELSALRAALADCLRIATEAAPDLEGQPDRDTPVRRVAALATRYEYERESNAILRAALTAAEKRNDDRADWIERLSETERLTRQAMRAHTNAMACPVECGCLSKPLDVLVAERLTAAEARVAEVERALRTLILVCEHANPGAFTNGNTHGGLDEGEVLTDRALDRARAALSPSPKEP